MSNTRPARPRGHRYKYPSRSRRPARRTPHAHPGTLTSTLQAQLPHRAASQGNPARNDIRDCARGGLHRRAVGRPTASAPAELHTPGREESLPRRGRAAAGAGRLRQRYGRRVCRTANAAEDRRAGGRQPRRAHLGHCSGEAPAGDGFGAEAARSRQFGG